MIVQTQNNNTTVPGYGNTIPVYTLGCSRCRSEFSFPVNVSADSLIQAGWVTDGKNNWSCPQCNNSWYNNFGGGCCD